MGKTLDGAVVVLTGAAKGLGREIALDLAEAADGITLVLIDRAEAELNDTVAMLEARDSATVVPIVVDLRDTDALRGAVGAALADLDQVDALINNAGTNVDATIESLSDEQWDDIVESNLRGAHVMSQLVWPYMKKQQDGLIVNVVSGIAMRVIPKSPAYPASKWGLRALGQSLYLEGREHNIRVTSFMPAGMATPLILDRKPDVDPDDLMDPRDVAVFLRKAILELPGKLTVPEVYVCRRGFDQWP